MSANKAVVERYLAAPRRSTVAELLADDVEWIEWGDGVPATGVRTRGRAAFVQNLGDDEVRTEVARLTEEGNVAVAEGTATVSKPDGRVFQVRFCNVFELRGGRIQRLSSFGALLQGSG